MKLKRLKLLVLKSGILILNLDSFHCTLCIVLLSFQSTFTTIFNLKTSKPLTYFLMFFFKITFSKRGSRREANKKQSKIVTGEAFEKMKEDAVEALNDLERYMGEEEKCVF